MSYSCIVDEVGIDGWEGGCGDGGWGGLRDLRVKCSDAVK